MLNQIQIPNNSFTLDLSQYKILSLKKIEGCFVLVFQTATSSNFIKVPQQILISKKDNILYFSVNNEKFLFTLLNFKNIVSKFALKNNIFKKKLKVNGLGFRITKQQEGINFKIGYSHLISLKLPGEITKFSTRKKKLKIESFDKIKLGNFAYKVYKLRKADIYKGKGFSFWNAKQKLKEIKKK